MGWEYIDLRPVAAAFLSLTVENPNLFKLTPSYLRVTGRRRRRRRPALRWGSDSRGFRQVLSLSLSLSLSLCTLIATSNLELLELGFGDSVLHERIRIRYGSRGISIHFHSGIKV